MESKDPLLPIHSPPGLRNRAKLPQLSLDSSAKYGVCEDITLVTESTASTPSASMSPKTPGDAPFSASTDTHPDSPIKDEEKGEGSTERRSTTATTSKSKASEGREKRKRSRVTPEQLTHLERFFAADRSPTAARRREIAELLGMQERQTQIWFQNRRVVHPQPPDDLERAKAKLLDGKKSRHLGNEWSDTPPDTPPQLSAGFEADLQSLIHEDHPISIIPCTDLSIGSWRRIATGKHDLVAYVCEAKRSLTWFIHSAGYGFKMEIPFGIITHTEFRNAAPGEGLATFHLSQPPNFFLEHIASPRSSGGIGGGIIKVWKKCSDWTEGMQASQVFRHDLIGSAVQLAHVLNDLREYRQRASISLLSPSAFSSSSMLSGAAASTSPTTMQIPQPPLASLRGEAFDGRPSFLGHSRKRSNSGPPALTRLVGPSYMDSLSSNSPVTESVASQPYSAGYVSTSFNRPSQMASYPYGQRILPEYISGSTSPSLQQTVHEQTIPDYTSVPISHGVSQRPFSSGPATTQFFPTVDRNSSPIQVGLRQGSTMQSPHCVTPSPPLMASYGTDPSMGLQGLSYMGQGGPHGQSSGSSPNQDQGSLASAFGAASDFLSTTPPM